MANEFKHDSVGTSLSQAEWEAIGTHVLDSQATGDIIYASSASQLRRLAISGTATHVLSISGGVPAWAAPAAAAAGSLTGTTLASGVVTSSLTTVGALNAGSITSGFGTINNGSSTITTTGAITGGSLVADATTINSNTISVSSANLTLDPDNDIIFSPSGISQNYGLSDRGHGLTLQSLTAANDFRLELFTEDGDATDTVSLLMYGRGTPSQMTNLERLVFYWDVGNSVWKIETDASGSGTTRDLRLVVPAGKDIILGDDAVVLTVKGDSTIDANSNALLNVAASGNDWDSTSLRSGLIESTVTGGTTQIGVKLKNLQTKVNGVGPMMAMYGHTTGQTMAYVYSVWAEESSAADTTTLNFATRNTAGSTDARMTIHGNGDVQVVSGDLTLTAGDLIFGAALDIHYPDNTTRALTLGMDGGLEMIRIDSRNAVSCTAFIIDRPDPTIASASGVEGRLMSLSNSTVTLTGTNTVTDMQGVQLYCDNVTITDTSSCTVTTASQVFLRPPTAGGSITITNNRIIDTSVSGCFLTAAGVWTDASSRQHKDSSGVMDLGRVPELLDQVEIESYRRWTDDGDTERFGVIAEDVPEFLASQDRVGVAPGHLANFALASVKYLMAEVEKLKQDNIELRAAVEGA